VAGARDLRDILDAIHAATAGVNHSTACQILTLVFNTVTPVRILLLPWVDFQV
jgi:hypothetical protein